jgi:lambda family phage portal protein
MQVLTKPRFRIGSDGSNLREVGRGRVGANYMRTDHSPFFLTWNPILRDQRYEVQAAYIQAAARTIDMMHNSGWLAGAFDQAVASTVGTGLRLAAKPDAAALGMSKETADAWAKDIEREWELWSTNPCECDATGKQTIGQMDKAVLHSYFSHGEAVALLPRVVRPWAWTQTKVKLLPAHKLVQQTDNVTMFQGVRMDGWGFPLAYRVNLRMEVTWDSEYPVDVTARDPATGRQQVVHVFDGAAGQIRGITPLAPALKVVRQFDQLSDATLQAALIQAIFAATVESEAPTAEVLQALQDEDEQGVGGGDLADLLDAKTGWYQKTKIDLGRGGKVAHLFPGEKLNFNASQHPNSTYEAFAKFLLREIARCLGMTFEALTGDYTGATYSSVRMATAEMWPIILSRRVNISARFRAAVYSAWLQEMIEIGRIIFPGGIDNFLAKRDAATRAEWRGPARPEADALKAQKAHEGYKRMGVVSDEQICADLGADYQDVYQQRAKEKDERKALDLTDGDTMTEAQDEALVNSLINDGGKDGG